MNAETGDPYYHNALRELQTTSFALVDLQLYLDTHPDDAVATTDFRNLAQRGRLLKRAYEERYGPLSHNGESRSPERVDLWINLPWPWEL